jgi:hypothetical protein
VQIIIFLVGEVLMSWAIQMAHIPETIRKFEALCETQRSDAALDYVV